MKKKLLVFIDRNDIADFLKRNLSKDFEVTIAPFEQEKYSIKDLLKYSKNFKNYDIIHTSSFFIPAYLLYRNKKKYGTKYTITLNGLIWKELEDYLPNRMLLKFLAWRTLQKLTEKIFAKADHIFFVSKSLEEKFRKRYRGIDKMSISYRPLQKISKKHLKKDHRIEDKIRFITITSGKFKEKAEGIKEIIKMLEKLKLEFTFDIIASAGKHEKLIKEIIENSKIKEKINYFGEVDTVYSLLKNADIFIYSSKLDAFPRVIREAKYIGLPVILIKSPDIKETVRHNKTGFIVKNSNELQDSLNKIIKDKKFREELLKNSREEVINQFSELEIFKKYKKVWEELV